MLGGGHLAMQPSCNGSFTQLTPDPLKSLKPMSLGLRSVHAEQLQQGIGSFTGCDAFEMQAELEEFAYQMDRAPQVIATGSSLAVESQAQA